MLSNHGGEHCGGTTMTHSDAFMAQEASRRAQMEMGGRLSRTTSMAHSSGSPLAGLSDRELGRLERSVGSSASAARSDKPDVQRPVLNELHDRLTLALDRLSGGVSRIDAFADRVLPATPSEPTCASGGAGTTCAAEALLSVVTGIERMASRLHEAADRVERIG